MYCPKCGTQAEEQAPVCMKCGEALQPIPQTGAVLQKIPNYLAQSILVTLFCCILLGIPAIVFAAQVNGKIQAGDITGAKESSRKAKLWCWWSFGVGLLVGVLQIFRVFAVAAAAAASKSGHY